VRLDAGPCVVRTWEPGDVPALARHANSYAVWRNVRDLFPHPYTEADAEQWVKRSRALDPQTSFAIVADGEVVGGIGLRRLEDVERCSAELGYWLGEAAWGRGLATAAVRVVTRYGLDVLGLSRVFAVVFVYNAASCRVLEKAGFEREGFLRSWAEIKGRRRDLCIYSLVRQ
jgi:RimJ/RimL family protein N-acetyltransferase